MRVETCNLPKYCEKNLDFRPELYRKHFDHLQRESSSNVARNEVQGMIRRDLTYLFWERFTKEKLVHFSYRFAEDGVISPNYEALGDVIASYEAAVEMRKLEGKSSDREEAELAGFLGIRDLKNSKESKSVLLISPPDTCGSYSFYFFGRYDAQDGQIDMYAWRNEKSLGQQREEASAILGGDYFSSEVHPNDFLRNPIIVDASDFSPFRRIICDMPNDGEFLQAKSKDFSRYRDGVNSLAMMLSALIANGADDATLRLAQTEVEMAFVKWMVDGEVEVTEVDEGLFLPGKHREFSHKVYSSIGGFVTQYGSQARQFACGTCGLSILSDLNQSPINALANLAPDLFGGGTKPCANCGATLEADAQTCDSCGMTKREFDLKQMPQR